MTIFPRFPRENLSKILKGVGRWKAQAGALRSPVVLGRAGYSPWRAPGGWKHLSSVEPGSTREELREVKEEYNNYYYYLGGGLRSARRNSQMAPREEPAGERPYG